MKKIFNQLRLRSGFARLKQELKKLKRQSHSVSLSEAENIAILVPIKNESELAEVEQFAKTLENENKKVKLLGFLFDSSLKSKLSKNIDLISNEDIKWNYIPDREKIKGFVNKEFDILINLCTDLCFPLMYTAAISKSMFKIAAYDARQAAFFDFMIETNEAGITEFSREIRYYLDKVK
ncbi:hypothetical protein Pedsa_0153 [Pseudopedobacter saltans DSM 12145]|uniref:Uncharacterized protein n=1 Tax=Pseudopedobacter saltans (strain ATCC 51119 / DSM 12145 / JCM 21818 / CCUG 39354 / LMG 10337 / NBRC 100064 / NCIMB 13643) TaxID=762903 RepID=F0SDL2_PSESL|nr:hypothetical protein [Pseudopedobacter saltans]ADY50739.1 hypothetical protein Pedsa_0153 [Pseudopedobacter saltans DSM 12145]